MDNSLPNCLLVDDLEENLIALKSLLRDEKMNIYTAKSGEEALEMLLKTEFAVALLDVQMPIMDGFELAEIMRSTEKTRSIPIIFVTAAGHDAERMFRGYEAGAVDYLIKPLQPKIVLSKVRIFLELYQQKVLLQEKLKRIKETEAHLQDALKSRDEFLSICSHELKTPLTSLKMQIQLIERRRSKMSDEEALSPTNMLKFIQGTDRSVERIIHLVNDMLDISRVATGRLSLNLEEVTLSDLVKDVGERLMPFIEMANCQLTYQLDDSVKTMADRFRIEQVITNLLSNAAKYAPEGEIILKVSKDSQHARIDVIDHGEGISEEYQKKVFERFERVGSNSTVSGLGLGLFISREIIEMHNGSLTLSSELGKGSTFSVKIPLRIS